MMGNHHQALSQHESKPKHRPVVVYFRSLFEEYLQQHLALYDKLKGGAGSSHGHHTHSLVQQDSGAEPEDDYGD